MVGRHCGGSVTLPERYAHTVAKSTILPGSWSRVLLWLATAFVFQIRVVPLMPLRI